MLCLEAGESVVLPVAPLLLVPVAPLLRHLLVMLAAFALHLFAVFALFQILRTFLRRSRLNNISS